MMKRSLFLLSVLLFSGSSFCSAASTYSEAVTAGDFVYVSAQLPVDSSGKIVVGDIGTLTNLVIDHIKHQLSVKGVTLRQVIKTEVCLTDIRNYGEMDAAYGARFPFEFPPARDVMEASNLPSNAPIQISCIASKSRH